MSQHDYINLRRNSKVVRDEGGYHLYMGEANHIIFEDFAGELFKRFSELVIWEPFAGHTGRCKSCDFCEDIGVKLIAYDLNPSDFRVEEKDATKYGPESRVQGVLFHPPYFGTTPMSSKLKDLSNALTKGDYLDMMRDTIKLIKESMVMGGLVAAIGRDYRTGGQRVRLDLWYLELFNSLGFKLLEVWSSEPDVVLVFER